MWDLRTASESGITPVVVVVLLTAITVSGAVTAYMMFEDVKKSQDPAVELPGKAMRIEKCYYKDSNVSIAIRNTEDEALDTSRFSLKFNNLVVDEDDYTPPPEVVEPQERFVISVNRTGSRSPFVEVSNGEGESETHRCQNLYDLETLNVALDRGTFSNTEFTDGLVQLEETGTDDEWIETTSGIGSGVALDSSKNVYASLRNGDLLKFDNAGNLQWSKDVTGTKLMDVETDGSDFIYTGGGDDSITKLDPGKNQIWKSSIFSNTVKDIDIGPSGEVYGVSKDDTVRKLDSSDGSEIWKFDTGENLEAVAVADSGDVFVGGVSHIYKLDSNGNKIYEISTSGKVDTISTHKDSYFLAGINDMANSDFEIKKIGFSGSTKWTYSGHSDAISEVEVLESGESLSLSRLSGDEMIKLDKKGNEMWRQSLSESGVAIEYRDGKIYEAGAHDVQPGQVAKFLEEHKNSGFWESENIDAGEEVNWKEVEIQEDLNGQTASLTLELSNNPGFSPTVHSETHTLTGGTESFDVGRDARYARVEVQKNGNGKKTPETEEVDLTVLRPG